MKLLRSGLVCVLFLSYLAWVFRLTDSSFLHAGLGDWLDPYFINALMEHWYQSLLTRSNPVSPPMFYPVQGTLGYSHGLVLYVPFYVAVRPFLHPFPAQTVMLLLVMLAGAMSLFAVFTRHLRLSQFQAALLAGFFLTSRNVTNGETGVWLQRASVFLIPIVLLAFFEVRRLRDGSLKLALAWLSGFLAALLFTQDYQTAVFAVLLAGLAVAALMAIKCPPTRPLASAWRANPTFAARVALIATIVAGAWTVFVLLTGGVTVRLAGLTIRSHDWFRPAFLAAAGALALAYLNRSALARLSWLRSKSWHVAMTLGAVMGLGVFVWIYLPAYREHHAFPEEDLFNLLKGRNPSTWHTPLDVMTALAAYRSMRAFVLVFVLAVLVWLPPLRFNRSARLMALVAIVITLFVMVVPLRFDGFSLWRSLFWPLPGFAAIRDPSRIVAVYELGVVLTLSLLLAHLRSRVALSRAIAVLVLALVGLNWNPERFDYIRTTREFDRWVAAPIAIDPTCRSFFMKSGPDAYVERARGSRGPYGIDPIFIALHYSLPTLNGYSAWFPNDWGLGFPDDPSYLSAARTWIARHQLTGVCGFDLTDRRMTPFDRN